MLQILTTQQIQLFIWLCCEHLQCVSLFGCVLSICSTCCQTDEDVFLICWCFFYLHVFSEVAARWALSATVGPLFNWFLQLNTLCMQQIHDILEIFLTLWVLSIQTLLNSLILSDLFFLSPSPCVLAQVCRMECFSSALYSREFGCRSSMWLLMWSRCSEGNRQLHTMHTRRPSSAWYSIRNSWRNQACSESFR